MNEYQQGNRMMVSSKWLWHVAVYMGTCFVLTMWATAILSDDIVIPYKVIQIQTDGLKNAQKENVLWEQDIFDVGGCSALKACDVTASASIAVGTVTVNTVTLPPAYTNISVCDAANIGNLCTASLAAGSVTLQEDQYADYFGNYHDYDTMRASRSIFNAVTTVQGITAFDGAPGLSFGQATALSADGNLIAIGASDQGLGTGGAVYIYRWQNGTWVPVQKILSPRNPITPNDFIFFGNAITMSYDGSVIVIADAPDNPQGDNPIPLNTSVWIYTYDSVSDQWLLQQEIPNLVPGFASANYIPIAGVFPRISATGKYIMIVCRTPFPSAVMYVRSDVCTTQGDEWVFQTTLASGNLNGGGGIAQFIEGTLGDISADGLTAVLTIGPGTLGGYVIFTQENNIWSLQQLILFPSRNQSARAATFFSADGQYLSLMGRDSTTGFDAIWVYVRRGGMWVNESTIEITQTLFDPFISYDGTVIIVRGANNAFYGIFRSSNDVYARIFRVNIPGLSTYGSGSMAASGNVFAFGGNNNVLVVRTAGAVIPDKTSIGGSLCVGGTATIQSLALTGNLQVNGVITTGASVLSCGPSASDEKVKRDIVDVDAARVKEFMEAIRPVHFYWKHPEKHLGDTEQQAGFIAQDIEEWCPDWVSTDVDAEGNECKSLQLPHEMLGYMVAMLKGLQQKDAEQDKKLLAVQLCSA